MSTVKRRSTTSSSTTRPDAAIAGPDAGSATIHVTRWAIQSGSNVRNRGTVLISDGDRQWDATAEGNGPVDALFRAVDSALTGVLAGHPQLVAYDIHAVAEGPDSEGVVTVSIEPPAAATGARASGRYTGTARNTNIIAASIEAYLQAINGLLAEEQWAGATEQTGDPRQVKAAAAAGSERRAEFDADEAHHDTTAWFER